MLLTSKIKSVFVAPQKDRTGRLLMFAFLLLFAVTAGAAKGRPKNVILFIGDGMGIGAITAARCAGPGEDGQLTLDTMPIVGLVKTHSESHLITDSAASGTALATGRKTQNGYHPLDSAGNRLPTITALAVKLGKSVGVVTTDAVTSPTPAVFYAHIKQRSKADEIAAQLMASPLTVAMGSGKQHFVPTMGDIQGRQDGQDFTVLAAQNGFDVVYEANALAASNGRKLLGLFAADGSGPTLEAMTDKAVAVLNVNRKGFFLMAESCLPDKGGHRNDVAMVVKGVADLDTALKGALAFAAKDRRTLVLVTADHDTGGLGVLNRNKQNPHGAPGWIHQGHTGNMVALYAYGPGAEKFSGTFDNTDIPKIIARLWGRSLD